MYMYKTTGVHVQDYWCTCTRLLVYMYKTTGVHVLVIPVNALPSQLQSWLDP